MKLLNLHGFMGKADNRTYAALSELMPKENIVSPKLDYMHTPPDELFCRLSDIIMVEGIDIIIGQSLGGFYALPLAMKHSIPCILTNPCLFPAETEVIVNSELRRDILDEYRDMSKRRYFGKAFILISDNDIIIPDNYEMCKDISPNIKQVSGSHSNITGLKDELSAILSRLEDPMERKVHLMDIIKSIDKILIVDDARTFDMSRFNEEDFETIETEDNQQ